MTSKILLNIKNLSISLQQKYLFDGLSFTVHRGEVISLIGANGCGKSTILDLVAEKFNNNDEEYLKTVFEIKGDIFLSKDIKCVYCPQVQKKSNRFLKLLKSPDKDQISAVRKIFSEFGINDNPEDTKNLSDGEFQKLQLAVTFMEDVDLYIYDEPTNYLDIQGILAFENHLDRLKSKNKGVILVSHDRELTDNVSDRTVLISPHYIFTVPGGATNARMAMTQDYQSRKRRSQDIRKKIRNLEADARAKAGWSATSEKRKIGAGNAKPYYGKLSAKMAKRAKAVQQRAEKEMERLEEIKPFVPKELNLQFPEYRIRNRDVFRFENTCFKYEDDLHDETTESNDFLLKEITFSASTVEKICIMGINGSGKTTLIKLAGNQLAPTSGTCYVNRNIKTVYLSQGLKGFFGADTLLDNFSDCGHEMTVVRQYLGAALIRKDKVTQPIDQFSHGELMRSAIVKCILSKAEFLFLDEPTTHLDIESIEVLEHLLQSFNGGFLLISHDRSFVSNVADRLYMLEDGGLRLV